jgi:hypothetical protein
MDMAAVVEATLEMMPQDKDTEVVVLVSPLINLVTKVVIWAAHKKEVTTTTTQGIATHLLHSMSVQEVQHMAAVLVSTAKIQMPQMIPVKEVHRLLPEFTSLAKIGEPKKARSRMWLGNKSMMRIFLGAKSVR